MGGSGEVFLGDLVRGVRGIGSVEVVRRVLETRWGLVTVDVVTWTGLDGSARRGFGKGSGREEVAGRGSCGGELWRVGVAADVGQDGADDRGIGDDGEDALGAATVIAPGEEEPVGAK